MTLPVALSGSDVIGQAKTGTGKTLGFGLPLLERVTVPADVEAGRARPEQLTEAPQALVVVPTRELCQQVTNDLLTAGKVRNVRVLSIYGGRAYEPQVEALKKGVDVVVGTPGRLLDLAGQKKLDLSHVKALVLDEADEMLDLGFLPDVERIINMLPVRRQTMLFSATMPGAVIGLARRYMSQPTHIRAAAPDDEGQTVANIKQHVFRAHSMDKPEMVARILQADGRGLAMIFCRTKRTAADIADQLARRGFASGAVHGDLGQGAREQALRAFRNGKVDVLVCTDVAARGIDVEGVTHVINYQSPEEEKTYLHRIGRTGRAGAKGTAITLVDWDDIPRWKLINKALDLPFDEPEETYSTSAHLYELLEIPEGTKGVLPRAARTRAGLAAEEVEDLGETGGRGRGPRRGGPVEEEQPRRTRTPRQRRRTRSGAPVDESGAPAASGTAEDGGAATDGPRQPRRRRRTRGGSGSASAAAGTPAREAAAPAAEGIASEAAQTDATAAPAKSRRRRTRGGANAAATGETATTTAAVAVDTAEGPAETVKVPAQVTAESPVVTEATEAEAPAKPRRRTRSAKPAAETAVETAESTETAAEPVADEAPAKPRRTRKTAAAKKAEAAADTAEATEAVAETVAEEAPAKPRRTRKTAAAKKAEAAVDAAEGTETVAETVAEEAPAKPRRTRKTAAKKTEAATEAVEPAADEAPAKPRRTRKTAATKKAEAAVDAAEATETEEAPAKPRRTRKTTAAKKAEAAADTAEGTETVAETVADEAPAKPRRTRKTAAKKTEAATEAVEPAADEAPAKPRRTRKTAASKNAETAPPADAAADEAPAKPRRTRKTAAKKAVSEATAEG
ncbi:DEAD/DEAH box helicase [Streptomyces sp. NPDC018019]|uniref:DEAD/DEAH box helicase n=1 Tax=Streptomyces sp. NPDC018019 TaxID=3365030 RepID=UPI0037A7811E